MWTPVGVANLADIVHHGTPLLLDMFLEDLSNEDLDEMTLIVDRMYRAVHNEKSKTKRKEHL